MLYVISWFLTWTVMNIAVNKIDIWRVRYHFSRDDVTVVWPLWRHQQNVSWASETRRRCVKIVIFIVIYGFLMSCEKYNDMIYVLSWSTVYVLTQMFFWGSFPSWLCNSGKKNTIINLSWGHKQLATRVHILFYILEYVLTAPDCI